jgi:NhaA family Na+:H+ antiporter
MHIESVSGLVLLIAAAAALIWANSSAAQSYHHVWHMPITLGVGSYEFTKSLHFWINDGLMTFFFLVVGMEIRKEIHDGALSSLRKASLPLLAAVGGVAVPALIYLALNGDPIAREGWAIPTATDIAFAVGILAILGRSIPSNVRILLLALAIIDDIIAVLIIALFYSESLDWSGFALGLGAVALVFLMRFAGVASAVLYIVPGALLWCGLLKMGVHPTLAGVVLGLLTPVKSARLGVHPIEASKAAIQELQGHLVQEADTYMIHPPLERLRIAQRELFPPVTRIATTLHPWVAYGIMPVFALANAGVTLGGATHTSETAYTVIWSILAALTLGKPIGIIATSWLAVRMGVCELPTSVTWPGVVLVGLLAGIGFTMSIFIANLAFQDEGLLNAAKLGILLGSSLSMVIGCAWGVFYARRLRHS